jgi:hypothetical protein
MGNTELRSLNCISSRVARPMKCDFECRIYNFEESIRDIFKDLIIDLSWKDRGRPDICRMDGNPRVLLWDV